MLTIVLAILVIWGGLTVWAELPGPAKIMEHGSPSSPQKALVVYDPDPIYNLDEQLCNAFAEQLARKGIYTIVATVKAANKLKEDDYTLYMFCANTYNWRPDRAITSYIKHIDLHNRQVAALTLGSGSTQASQKAFDRIIKSTGASIVDSRTLWLLRPNDESRMKEPNVQVAVSMTRSWADSVIAMVQ